MSDDKYFTIPLSILRSGKSEMEALDNAISVGIVNAGVGFTKTGDQDEVEEMLEAARRRAEKQGEFSKMRKEDSLKDASGITLFRTDAESLWNQALLGWQILDVNGGNRTEDAQRWLNLHRQGEVFFRIKDDFLWTAVNTARRDSGADVAVNRPLSWREFRVLAAILSAKVNSYGFVFMGWEVIQARASGYHSKDLFFDHKDHLPGHCKPLTRSVIRGTCEKLEALGFFARVRYAAGPSGGYMAYSVTMERTALQDAVNRWRADNDAFKTKIASHRKSDQEAFKRKR